jgi:hypothetical protein
VAALHERSADEVFHDHLQRASDGDVEGDIEQNYAEDVVLLDNGIVRHGRQGTRDAAAQLEADAPGATYTYVATHVFDELAYLEWTADSDGVRIEQGVDSFLIRDGLIRVQTIYYRVVR